MLELNRSLVLIRLVICGFSIVAAAVWAQEEPLGSEVQEFQQFEDDALDARSLETSPPPSEPVPANEPPAPTAVTSDAPTPEPTAPSPADSKVEAPTGTESKEAVQAEASPNESAPPEPSPEPAVVETPKSAPSDGEEVARDDSEKPSEDVGVKGTYGGRVFGRKKVQLAANRPVFDEDQTCYSKFYGKPQTHMSISGEWFPLDWWVNPGLITRIGVYSVRGKAVSGSSESTKGVSCDSLSIDENSSTGLLLVPIQVGAKIQFSPFRRKWLVLDYWTAAELDWWQETRNSAASNLMFTASDSSSQVYTSTGRKKAVSVGASVHLLLNPLDEGAVRSMIDTMGIGYVYLSGFMEKVKSTSSEGLTFDRNVMGVGFTFEAYK